MTATQPLKVLHLRDTHEIGGPGKTILETFRAIDHDRFHLHLGMFLREGAPDDSPFITGARLLGMPVHLIRAISPFDPRMILRLARLVRTERIDVIEGHEPSSDVMAYLASFFCRVTLINTTHGWIANNAKQRFFNTLDELVLRRFALVMPVSGKLHAELLAAGVKPSRLRLLHNAIVLDKYRRTGQQGYLEGLLGRRLDGPVLASIGRLSAEKGHADLIEALAQVAAGGGQFSAVLAGDGPERESLLARIRAAGLEGQVHLPGYVSEPARILEETDLMVLPSHTEGLPNAALEALIMNVPVLATRVGGTPEVITDGETGRLVEPRSPAQLAAAITDFLAHRDAWLHMAERGRRMVEERFDFNARTRKLEAIYSTLSAGSFS